MRASDLWAGTEIRSRQTGLPVPYILGPYRTVPNHTEPYRTVPSICEPNHLPARNFRARAEPNRGEDVRYGTIRYG
jgi:hypothetical protein